MTEQDKQDIVLNAMLASVEFLKAGNHAFDAYAFTRDYVLVHGISDDLADIVIDIMHDTIILSGKHDLS